MLSKLTDGALQYPPPIGHRGVYGIEVGDQEFEVITTLEFEGPGAMTTVNGQYLLLDGIMTVEGVRKEIERALNDPGYAARQPHVKIADKHFPPHEAETLAQQVPDMLRDGTLPSFKEGADS